MADPRSWRAGASPIDPGIVAQVAQGMANMRGNLANQNPSSVPPPFNPPFSPTVTTTVNWRIQVPQQEWFGPGQPMSPVAPADNAGRMFDYPTYSNIDVLQKPREGVDFPILRALANSYDLVGLMIDTRCDQLAKLPWSIGYRKGDKEADASCEAIEDFLQKPDGEHDWQEWLRLLTADMLEIDAATVFPRQTRGGKLYALETIDGATINRVIDNWGRTPLPPDPAYQQRLKGLPAVNYTREQLIYKPRNIRNYKLFGTSPVERIIIIIQTAISRQLYQMQYYTDGSTPDLIFSMPPGTTQKQAAEFEAWFNAKLSGNTSERRRASFVPAGIAPVNVKEQALTDPLEQWLARVVCYCFGMSPQPFVAQMNRATAETANEQAKEEGIGPHMRWVVGLMNHILAHPLCFNRPDLEFTFDDAEELDPKVRAEIQDMRLKNGSACIDEIRDENGEDPLPNGMGQTFLIYTGSGTERLEDAIKEPEPMPDPVAMSAPGQPPKPGAVGTQPPQKVAKAKPPVRDAILPTVVGDVDVPYGFGVSEDGKRVYRDRRIPPTIKLSTGLWDVDLSTSVHELSEYGKIKEGKRYDVPGGDGAHQFATTVENIVIRGMGHDPDEAQAALQPYLDLAYKAALAGEAREVPEDLAAYPYEQEGELSLIQHRAKVAKRGPKKKTEPAPSRVKALAKAAGKVLTAARHTLVAAYTVRLGKAAGQTDDTSDFLDSLDLGVFGGMLDTYIDLTTQEAEEAFTDAVVSVGADAEPVFGIANTRAQQIAEDRASELIGSDADSGELAESTRELIRSTIADAFDQGWTSDDLASVLADVYAFSDDRADLIADTEMRMAIGAGAIEGARSTGVATGKQWLLSNDEGVCDECEGNADQGVIGIDEDFDSGDDTVPAHPNCRCVVVFTTDDEGEDE